MKRFIEKYKDGIEAILLILVWIILILIHAHKLSI